MKWTISAMKRSVLPILCLGLAAAAAVYAQSSPDYVMTQERDQVAISFYQIDRVLLHGEMPPAPDSFVTDAATIASLPPLQAEVPSAGKAVALGIGNVLVSSALGMIPYAGSFIGGAANHAMNAAEQAAKQHEIEKTNAALWRTVNAGTLSHFAFYHGWLRSEQRKGIRIVKPDEGLTYILNPDRKTVRVLDAHHGSEVIEVDDSGAEPPLLVGEPVTERLPDANVAGIQARGYRTKATVELRDALGWCGVGRHAVTQVEYVADMPDPQPPITIAAAQSLADGCAPASTASYRESGHLVLYRATSTDPDTPKGITLMFERGNVHTLDENSMSLFSVPADFTKEQ